MSRIEVQHRVPDGVYEMICVRVEPYWFRKSVPKLACIFVMADRFGEFKDVELTRHYNIKAIDKKNGITIKRTGALIDEIVIPAMNADPKLRVDRFSVKSAIKGKLIMCKVGTVKQSYKQKKLPEGLRYSVIEEVNIGTS